MASEALFTRLSMTSVLHTRLGSAKSKASFVETNKERWKILGSLFTSKVARRVFHQCAIGISKQDLGGGGKHVTSTS